MRVTVVRVPMTTVKTKSIKREGISRGNAGNGRGVRTCVRCSAFWRVILCNSMPPKSKEANRSTSTNEAEDEVLTALSMAGVLGKKVDMILNKLQKLHNIEARLDNLHKSIASLEESCLFGEGRTEPERQDGKNEDEGRRA